MLDYIINFQFNNLLVVLLYWSPLGFCVFGYTVRTAKNYRKDISHRSPNEKSQFYYPTDTLGDIVGRAIVSLIPIANLWAACFDLAPEIFRRLFDVLGALFNQPLVPDSDGYELKRKELHKN